MTLEEALRAHRYDSVGMVCSCGVECGIKCDEMTREQHLSTVIAEAGYAPIPEATKDAWHAIDQFRSMADTSDEMRYGTLSSATVRQYLNRIEGALHPYSGNDEQDQP